MYRLRCCIHRRRMATPPPMKPSEPLSRTETRWRSVSPVQASSVTHFCAFSTASCASLHNRLQAKPLKLQAAASTLPPTLPSPRSKSLSGISKQSAQILSPRPERSVARHRHWPRVTGIASPCFQILSPRRLSFKLLPPMPGNRYLHLPMTGAGHQLPSSPSATPANSSSVWDRTL